MDDGKCNKCGVNLDDDNYADVFSFLQDLYAGRLKPDVGDLCKKCFVDVIPWLLQLRDIDELKTYVNKLKGAIKHENNRNKNYGTT